MARLGFTAPAPRGATLPSTAITYSGRTMFGAVVHGRVDILVKHHLGDAVAVAQIDEDHAAMIAAAVDPAHQDDGLALVGGAQHAAGVGAAKFAQKIQCNREVSISNCLQFGGGRAWRRFRRASGSRCSPVAIFLSA